MHGPYIKPSPPAKAKKTYLIAFVDDASRRIVGAEFFFSENAANVKTVLRNALLTFGVPAKLYLDHGRNFRADDIRIACATMETALIHTSNYDSTDYLATVLVGQPPLEKTIPATSSSPPTTNLGHVSSQRSLKRGLLSLRQTPPRPRKGSPEDLHGQCPRNHHISRKGHSTNHQHHTTPISPTTSTKRPGSSTKPLPNSTPCCGKHSRTTSSTNAST